MKCDDLIIGAGLSGATCGFLLSRQGRAVLAVDSADLTTKDKLCGGMLTSRALETMSSIYGPESASVYQESFESMLAIDMRVQKGSAVALLDGRLSIARRKDLDAYAVCRFLDAGGMLADRSRMTDVDPLAHRAVIATLAGELRVEYGNLIVADGVNSPTRKLLSQFDENLASKPRYGHVPCLEGLTEPVLPVPIGWYVPAIGGYCWYFPCGDHANVGVDGMSATAGQLKETLHQFTEMLHIPQVHDLRGAFAPSGGCPLVESRDAYYVGDAAGLVCPVTSEGIYYALESARELADCLQTDGSYAKAMAPHVRTLKMQHVLSKLLYNDKLTGTGVRIAEMVGIDVAQIPRIALRTMASFVG